MRKVIVSEFVSLDGVMEAPDQWHVPFWHDAMGTSKSDRQKVTGGHGPGDHGGVSSP
jgi:hypothetical protein